MSISGAVLSLHAVRKRFGGVLALDGVDLDLQPGEIHGLVGQNGAGKSTIMKLLAGAHSGYEGEIRVGGELRRFASPADAQAHGIAMVYQELSTFGHLTVAENIFGGKLPVRRGFVSWKTANRIAAQHLAELGLDIDVTTAMDTLPVGRQQLVEIARVVWSGARTIILDEPTSALSHPETRRLFELMRALKAQGKTLVFISHFLDDVIEICDRTTVLKNGRHVATLRSAETEKQRLIGLMLGRDAATLSQSTTTGAPAAETAAPGEEVLRVEHLSKAGAFTDVSFTLRKGEILGCFAFMGAGQTQLGRCLFGADRADEGTVHQDGKLLRLTSTTRAREAGIAFVPEDRRNALMMSKEIFKNITIAHLGWLLPRWLREAPELEIADTWMKRVGVHPRDPRLPVGALSGGNQQKVVLAKWLTRPPRVLLLNEPTRGMDVEAKEEVLSVIRGLRDAGGSALLISTEPETILAVANRAVVMSKGNLTAALGGAELTKENLMRYA